jgi:hypothetical protein
MFDNKEKTKAKIPGRHNGDIDHGFDIVYIYVQRARHEKSPEVNKRGDGRLQICSDWVRLPSQHCGLGPVVLSPNDSDVNQ